MITIFPRRQVKEKDFTKPKSVGMSYFAFF